ncbi:MAG: YgiT-type zinc finger protein [Candidatus Woesearchaeota archaeon]
MKKKPAKKCYECGGNLVRRSEKVEIKGNLVGYFPAEVCNKCGEVYFDEKTSRKMTKAAKEKGLWGLESVTKLGRIGDSLGVIINRRIIDFMGLKKGETVKVHPEGKNRIIIEI